MWWKSDKQAKISALSVLSESEILHSDISALQGTADGFVLAGNVHFNEIVLHFDEGACRFLLRNARLHATAEDCHFDYESIAYVETPPEEATVDLEVSSASEQRKAKGASAEGSAGADLASGISIGGRVRGKISGDFETATARSETIRDTKKRSYVLADVFSRGDKIGKVVWTILPDPTAPRQQGGEVYDVVHGQRLRQANEGAGLAYVRLDAPSGYVDLELEIRVQDITWTDCDFPPTSRLHKYRERLINGRTKKDVVGRAALAQALAGRILLHRVPR